MKPWESAVAYHEATKHHFHRLARSLGYMDWANQPDPFRRFAGAPTLPLVLTAQDRQTSYNDLFEPGKIQSQPVSRETISIFFELSLAISAWKEYRGTRWALRINPSSGNLHPTEGYLVTAPIQGLSPTPGVYHYAPREHVLERRTEFSLDVWQALTRDFPPGTFFVGLTSIHWREAWKYGERAYRYCQHDVGHAAAALAFSAALQGWSLRLVHGMGDEQIATLLGVDRAVDFDRAEDEAPELLAAVILSAITSSSLSCNLPQDVLAQIRKGVWTGKANRLSERHVAWDGIEMVSKACVKPDDGHVIEPTERDEGTRRGGQAPGRVNEGVGRVIDPTQRDYEVTAHDERGLAASQIIRRRRSAVALDGHTGLSADRFYAMLDRCLPRWDRGPFSALRPPACVHLGLFVHLVEGIPPGLYCLVRSPEQREKLRASMRPTFAWEQPPACPKGLGLYLLHEGDVRRVACRVSCDQEIAGAGAFSLAMIAEFTLRLQQFGAWFYRRLHWETGVIGQVLYLEAEAAGIRGTGMGCFFDDPVHEVFGLHGDDYQTLYHFTMGGPVEDPRLTTLPPYGAAHQGNM